VFGHRREHHRVRTSLGDQQRHPEVAQHVVVVDLARAEAGADPRGHRHVPAQRGLEVLSRDRLGQAGTHERAHAADVRRQVIGGEATKWSRKPGADQRAERRLAQLDRALDEVDRATRSWPYARR
jgi:hypothetical protein